MQVRQKEWGNRYSTAYSVRDALARILHEADFDERGTLERQRARLEKLTEIVGYLAERSGHAVDVLNDASSGWELAE